MRAFKVSEAFVRPTPAASASAFAVTRPLSLAMSMAVSSVSVNTLESFSTGGRASDGATLPASRDPGRSKRTTVEVTVCSKRNATPAASHASLMRGMPVPYCSMTSAL